LRHYIPEKAKFILFFNGLKAKEKGPVTTGPYLIHRIRNPLEALLNCKKLKPTSK
tara:strand:- start:3220 stop:3384 length:165 start_codon:yes stop_codon:yes gene_type:complete